MTTAFDRAARLAAAGLLAITIAACGASAPPATSAPTAHPTEAPTPTPEPTPDDQALAAAALAAFADLVERDDLAYHLTQDASVKVDGTAILDATYGMDVNGSDFAGSMDLGTTKVDISFVDNTLYTRVGDAAWQTGQSIDEGTLSEILEPWRLMGKLEDLEFDSASSATVTFRNSSPIPYQTSAMKQQGYSGEIDALEFVIGEDGTPVSIDIHATAAPKTGVLANRNIDMHTTVAFDKVGEPTPIEKPE